MEHDYDKKDDGGERMETYEGTQPIELKTMNSATKLTGRSDDYLDPNGESLRKKVSNFPASPKDRKIADLELKRILESDDIDLVKKEFQREHLEKKNFRK